MRIGIPRETQVGESRVAATPETIKKLINQGHSVTVASRAGLTASIADQANVEVGASIASQEDALAADIVRKVVAPSTAELE